MYDSSSNDARQLFRLGLDPERAFYDLNLAGVQGWPPMPDQLTQAEKTLSSMQPDYALPDSVQPSLKPYDLTLPGITAMPEFAPDPALPALTAYSHPYDVDMIGTGGIGPTPEYAHDIPSQQEIAASLDPGLGFSLPNVCHEVTASDPPVADLQNPALLPEVRMPSDQRPGDLDPQAMEILSADSHFQQTADKNYPASQMDARGMNDTRARHMALLTDGLMDGRRDG